MARAALWRLLSFIRPKTYWLNASYAAYRRNLSLFFRVGLLVLRLIEQSSQKALRKKIFRFSGKRLEQNALTMHATMHAASPPIIYWKPETIATLHSILAARNNGLPIYLTMDAGPNIKVFFLKKNEEEVLRQFSNDYANSITLLNTLLQVKILPEILCPKSSTTLPYVFPVK